MTYKNIDLSQLDPQIDIQIAKDFIDHRKAIKKPLTQRAFNTQMNNALRAFELEAYGLNMTPNDVIEWVLDNTTWQGINIFHVSNRILGDKESAQQAMQKSIRLTNQNTRNIPLQQHLNDRSWARH